jgi:hypothetical protein
MGETYSHSGLVNRRPRSVTLMVCVFVAAGATALAYHMADSEAQSRFGCTNGGDLIVKPNAIVAGVTAGYPVVGRRDADTAFPIRLVRIWAAALLAYQFIAAL